MLAGLRSSFDRSPADRTIDTPRREKCSVKNRDECVPPLLRRNSSKHARDELAGGRKKLEREEEEEEEEEEGRTIR